MAKSAAKRNLVERVGAGVLSGLTYVGGMTLLIGSTYFSRTLMGATVPGMLVDGLRLTL